MKSLDKNFRHLSREDKLKQLVDYGWLDKTNYQTLLSNPVIDEEVANSLIENVIGQGTLPVGLFSYGSGSVGEFFSATVVEGFEQHLDKKAHQALLNERQEVSVKEYESFFRRFDDLSFDHEIENVENDKNIFYLENIEDDIRYYHSPE